MKKVLFATAGLLALTVGAQAADLRRSSTPIPSVVSSPAIAPWTGFSFGAHLGYGFGGRFDTNAAVFNAAAPFTANVGTPAGIFGGLQAGYDWQINNVVLGVAADASYGDIRRRVVAGGLLGTPAVTAQLQFQGSLRLRAGVLVAPDLLLYATGGLAAGTARVAVPSVVAQTNTHLGWTVGVGGEYRFSPNLSTFVEYRYTDLDRRAFNAIVPGLRAGYDGHSVRLGLNYRFGGDTVVRAAY